MKTLVKMCGITSCDDARMADRAGADCIGVAQGLLDDSGVIAALTAPGD